MTKIEAMEGDIDACCKRNTYSNKGRFRAIYACRFLREVEA